MLLCFYITPLLVQTPPDVKTYLMLELYFEAGKQKKTLSYTVRFPQNQYYSYYLGSDLPKWHFDFGCAIHNQFHPAELVTIRLYPNTDFSGKDKLEKIKISIQDIDNFRTIWKGKIYYKIHPDPHDEISIITKKDNSKYYVKHLNTKKEKISFG